jgi:threonine synthase
MSGHSLRCVECGAACSPGADRLLCPSCSSLQEPGQALRGVLEVVIDALPDHWPNGLDAPSWRDWLPLDDAPRLAAPTTGATPLLEVPGLRKRLSHPALWIKDDGRNPSASAKDRASWLVCMKAIEFGLKTVATASTGNAASALACMCAALDLECRLFVPAKAPPAKLDQMRAFGAELVLIDGSYDQAFETSMQACITEGWYNRNTGCNPYTIEGKKTLSLEIAAQLSPIEPDCLFVSSGDGVIVHGVIRGLEDLLRAGLLSKMPRVFAVQSERSDALWRGWKAGNAGAACCEDACSVADSLNVNVPRNAYGALSALNRSGGELLRVTDEEILRALVEMASSTGVFSEPAGAASLAGFHEARRCGLIKPDDKVVLIVTGSGLKDPAAARRHMKALA